MVVLLIFLILTVFLFYYDATTDVSGTEWVFVLVIIPGFVISAIVAVVPGAYGGLLGARVVTWVEDRFQRTIDPRIGPIIGGALGVLVLVVLFVLYMYIQDVLADM